MLISEFKRKQVQNKTDYLMIMYTYILKLTHAFIHGYLSCVRVVRGRTGAGAYIWAGSMRPMSWQKYIKN